MLSALVLLSALQAAPTEVTGHVQLQCVVRAGKLQDCKAASETPPGRGFARAAVAIARQMTAPGKEGERVKMPVKFEMSVAEAAAMGITPPGSPPLVEAPKWLKRPRDIDIAALYPPAAERAEVSGFGIARCTVAEAGDLKACSVVQEWPEGYGFGKAAVEATDRFFRLGPVDNDGRPTAGRPIDIPVNFVMVK